MYPRNNLKLGDWKATCDRCGFDFHASQLKPTWDNLMVCKECWEPRHPQDFLRGVPDDPSVAWTRPDELSNTNTQDIEGSSITSINVNETVDDADKTLTVGSNSVVQIWNTALTADRTVTLDTTGASEGDKFIIYRTGGGAFSLNVGAPSTLLVDPTMDSGTLAPDWSGNPAHWEKSAGKLVNLSAGTNITSTYFNTLGTRIRLQYTIGVLDASVVRIGGEVWTTGASDPEVEIGVHDFEYTYAGGTANFQVTANTGSAGTTLDDVQITLLDESGTVQTIPDNVNGVTIVEFNGSMWQLIDYYTLGL